MLLSGSGLQLPQSALWVLRGANLNVTTDQAFTKNFYGTLWVPTLIIANRISGAVSLAAGGLYTSASKGGNAIVAAGQAYANLSGALTSQLLTMALTGVQNSNNLFLSLTTANGAALVSDLFVYGLVID